MAQDTELKKAIAALDDLTTKELKKTEIIKIVRPWMLITGLDFKDALHVTPYRLWTAYDTLCTKLGDVLDVLDDDQLQEAACRCLGEVTVYGELIEDDDVAVHHGITISWDGSVWAYITDPKLRMRQTSKSFREALEAVQEMLAHR